MSELTVSAAAFHRLEDELEEAEVKAAAAQVALGMASEEVRELRAKHTTNAANLEWQRNEIGRLRADVKRLEAAYKGVCGEWGQDIREREAEVARLTEALRELRTLAHGNSLRIIDAALSPGKVPE